MVTTPQEAAAEVAERAGTMASMMHQRVIGVVENMSYPALPALRPRAPAGDLRLRRRRAGSRRPSTNRLGYDIPLLGEIPLDERLRAGGDNGTPLALTDPEAPASGCSARSPSGSAAARAACSAASSACRPPADNRVRQPFPDPDRLRA